MTSTELAIKVKQLINYDMVLEFNNKKKRIFIIFENDIKAHFNTYMIT